MALLHKYHYIYKIICIATNKFYIGMHSTNNLDDGYMGSGVHLQRSISKHGLEHHAKEILEFLPDRESLAKRESELVTEDLLSDELCMNLTVGGAGGWAYHNAQPENKVHRRAGRIATNKIIAKRGAEQRAADPVLHERWISRRREGRLKNYGTTRLTPDWSGKTHSEESKQKMSEAASKRVGNKNSQFGTCWIYCLNRKKSIKISLDELDAHLKNGWIKGRRLKF